MVVPAFGFSVGDFVSLIGLIAKTAKALRETDGATTHYHQAVLDLESIQSVLRQVQTLQPTLGHSDLIEQIQLLSHVCHPQIAKFCQRIQDFDKHLQWTTSGSKSPVAALKKAGVQVKWAVLVQDEVAKLKASIAPQLTVIELLLQLENVESQLQLKQVSNRTLDYTKDLLARTRQLEDLALSQVGTLSRLETVKPVLDSFSLQTTTHFDALHSAVDNAAYSVQHLDVKFASQQAMMEAMYEELKKLSQKSPDQSSTPIEIESTTGPSNTPAAMIGDSLMIFLTFIRDLVCGLANFLSAMIQRTAFCSVGSSLSTPTPTTVQRLQLSSTPESNIEAELALCRSIRHTISKLMIVIIGLIPLLHRFARMLSTLPALSRMLLQDKIYVEDALGRTWNLPFQQFQHLPVLRALLQCEFRGLPGEKLIQLGQYDLYERLSSTRLNGEQDPRIRPGSHIVMSMRLKKILLATNTCPRCSCVSVFLSRSIWRKCEKCGLMYLCITTTSLGASERDKCGPLQPASRPEISTAGPQTNTTSMLENVPEDQELHHFKRAHYFTSSNKTQNNRQESRLEESHIRTDGGRRRTPFVTNNFMEFLTLYGHFAGEDLDEDDPAEYFESSSPNLSPRIDELDESDESGGDIPTTSQATQNDHPPPSGQGGVQYSQSASVDVQAIWRRHLVQGPTIRDSAQSDLPGAAISHAENDDFFSLQLQGGDATREIYRYVQRYEQEATTSLKRSRSFSLPRAAPSQEETDDFKRNLMPGGFRREFLSRSAHRK